MDDATWHLEGALALELEMGARPFAARTQLELARVLRSRGGRRGTGRADELVASAHATVTEIGAPGVLGVSTQRS